ncbi:MAG: hypothetical protein LBI05_10520 [Planctomycetaceae bacterium]|nr:hypothetical protein [Planctomycetaceae bacterium]
MLTHKTIFVLDAHGLLYQLFHALPPMSSPMGEPVGAVYGFTKDIFGLLEKYKPDYLFCAFDLPGQTFRSELYTEYKANRSTMPDDLQPQIGFVHEILEAFNIPPLSLTGFEADDVMATVAKLTAEQNGDCVIVTSDKDCRQLINDHVSLLNLRKQSFYKTEELLTDWGIRPDQVIDFQSLVGDSTDNIPGVAKVGQKTATELLQQFGTLEGVYENIAKISGKKKEYLLAGQESAFLSRQLVTLKTDVPISLDWNEYDGFDAEKLRALFQRFGFKSLLGKLDGDMLLAPEQSRNRKIAERSQSYDCGSVPPTYHLVDTPENFDNFFAQLQQQAIFSIDTETAPMENRFEATSPRYTVIVGISFAWNDHEAWYLSFRAPLGSRTLPQQQTLDQLRPILENPAIKKIGQNLKYDSVVLKNAGVNFQGIAFDTMLADYLLRNGAAHNLDDMAEHYLQYQTIKIEALIGKGKNQKRMDAVFTETVAEYAGEDALVTWHLYQVLKEGIAHSV